MRTRCRGRGRERDGRERGLGKDARKKRGRGLGVGEEESLYPVITYTPKPLCIGMDLSLTEDNSPMEIIPCEGRK